MILQQYSEIGDYYVFMIKKPIFSVQNCEKLYGANNKTEGAKHFQVT